MKRVLPLFIIIFAASITYNCSESNPTESAFGKYQGSWVWTKTVGGFFPRVILPNMGHRIVRSYLANTFVLTENSDFKMTANIKIQNSEFGDEKVTYSNIKTYDYYFDDRPEYISVKSDTMVVWDGMIDGFYSFFERIQ